MVAPMRRKSVETDRAFMDDLYLIFIGICILNPCIQNVGMGLQKWSVDKTPASESKREKRKWVGIWILGLLFQAVVVVLGSIALGLGNAATVGGFAGLGLIFLAGFSRLVLKEIIVPKEYAGMALIVAGTVVLGAFSHGSQSAAVNMKTERLVMFFSVYLAFAGVGIFLLTRNLHTYGGAILGIIGGSMNALGVIFQKVVVNSAVTLHGDSAGIGAIILKLLSSGWTYLMIVGGVGGLIVIQFGYKYGKAVQVVPGHASMVVMLPAIAGVIILGETVPIRCILSIVLIAIGVLITTTAAPGKLHA